MAKGVLQNIDKEFVQLLNQIKAERLIKDGSEFSFRELTKEIAETEEFRKLVNNLTKNKKILSGVRLDKKSLW